MQIHVLQHLELPCLKLQLIQPLAAVEPVLDELLLLPALCLDIVLQPLDDLLLGGDLILTAFQLLLEYLLALLCLCKLLPEGCV